MKNTIFISLLGLILLTIPLSAQQDSVKRDTTKKSSSGMGRPGSSEMMAKPSFEASNSGIHVKFWLMSKNQDAKETEVNTEVTTEGDTKPFTHHIMVSLTDEQDGKEITDANVTISTVSPTARTSTVDLEKMTNQYGGNVILDEKGDYEITLNIDNEGKAITFPLKYNVK